MAKNKEMLTKRLAISKTNLQIVIAVGVASFVTVFCLVAAHAVWSQNSYEARVVKAESSAYQQLQDNLQAYNSLQASYNKFVNQPTNVLGGQSNATTGSNTGNNAQIILDALPPTYDFPALITSVQKILNNNGFPNSDISIAGTDQQLTEQTNNASTSPQPVSMPFSFTVSNASYASIVQLISSLQQSIRPIQIDTMALSGGANNMTINVTAHTYYQPAKDLNLTKQVVQ